MKPIFNRVAKTLKEENENSVIAFVDCTKETKLNSRYKINRKNKCLALFP